MALETDDDVGAFMAWSWPIKMLFSLRKRREIMEVTGIMTWYAAKLTKGRRM